MTAEATSFSKLPAPDARVPLAGFAAPVVAVLAGMAAQWLDFRALRLPLLLLVGFGVLATALVLADGRRGWRTFALAVGVGAAAWATEQTVYVMLHVALREPFEAERFGPQWSQAIILILAHGLFLGVPTGAFAGLLLHLPPLRDVRPNRS